MACLPLLHCNIGYIDVGCCEISYRDTSRVLIAFGTEFRSVGHRPECSFPRLTQLLETDCYCEYVTADCH